jgi:hypothetical protein
MPLTIDELMKRFQGTGPIPGMPALPEGQVDFGAGTITPRGTTAGIPLDSYAANAPAMDVAPVQMLGGPSARTPAKKGGLTAADLKGVQPPTEQALPTHNRDGIPIIYDDAAYARGEAMNPFGVKGPPPERPRDTFHSLPNGVSVLANTPEEKAAALWQHGMIQGNGDPRTAMAMLAAQRQTVEREEAGKDRANRKEIAAGQAKATTDAAKYQSDSTREGVLDKATIDGIAAGGQGQMTPEALQALQDFTRARRSQLGGAAPMPGQAGSPTPAMPQVPGQPTAPMPGGQPLDLAGLGVGAGKLDHLRGAFGTVQKGGDGRSQFTPSAELSTKNAEKLFDSPVLGTLSPEEKKLMAREIIGGKFGPADQIIPLMTKAAAAAQFRGAWPTDPNTGKPVDFGSKHALDLPMSPATAPPFVVKGDDGQPLYTYRVGPVTAGGAIRNHLRSGGVPYNEVVGPDGRPLPISPTDLYNPLAESFGGINKDQVRKRAGSANEILQLIKQLNVQPPR